MLKYVSKFAMDILPSVVATILGAYIVNHYIATKPGTGAPVAAAVSPADPKKAAVKPSAKPSEISADVGNIPERGVKAKGVSERAILEKTAAEKPAAAEKPQEKSQEKSADKPLETASIPADTRRHQPGLRERAIARFAPAPVSPPTPAAVAPVIAAPNTAPPVETATPVEEHRDANELARAAIERLRGAGEGSPRPQESSRVPDAPRVVSTPPAAAPLMSAPPVRPLPPPIMVSTPATETLGGAPGSSRTGSANPAAAGIDDPGRPTPPADIPEAVPPPSRPLDLRAEAVEPARREHTTVAEDVLLAAKSVFHAVLPK
ncbi:MAG TPA: hypothetical protein VHQ48_01470 [Bradyrhizobium sp.]|jgi:hypothetical protein|nr:hypothetical protein [Bradyrhizobium sp.]